MSKSIPGDTIKVKCSALSDAVKINCSYRGQALLQWDFTGHGGSARHSVQMPEEVVDQILTWRDIEKEVIRLRGIICDFCGKTAWSAGEWKEQGHVKPLFDEVVSCLEQGKATHTPTTTNSQVDMFIKKHKDTKTMDELGAAAVKADEKAAEAADAAHEAWEAWRAKVKEEKLKQRKRTK